MEHSGSNIMIIPDPEYWTSLACVGFSLSLKAIIFGEIMNPRKLAFSQLFSSNPLLLV